MHEGVLDVGAMLKRVGGVLLYVATGVLIVGGAALVPLFLSDLLGGGSMAPSAVLLADLDETTFRAGVSGSLNQLAGGSNGLKVDGVGRLAGFLDVLHTRGDTTATLLALRNPTKVTAPQGSASAVLNDHLETEVWQSEPLGSDLGPGSQSPGLPDCPTSPGRVGSGPPTPTVERTSAKALYAEGPIMPPGRAVRFCVYLSLPTTTPTTVVGGQVTFDVQVIAK